MTHFDVITELLREKEQKPAGHRHGPLGADGGPRRLEKAARLVAEEAIDPLREQFRPDVLGSAAVLRHAP